MKTIRLGNDISVQWTITRLGEPEVFDGKDISVQLIDKLGNPQVFDYVLNENVISGTFYGKDQVTNGTYRLLLVENAGEEYMVTLDYIDCFCLSNKMKNQTSNGSDTTSSINTEVISISSEIDLSEDLSQYAKITYVDGQIADVKTYVDSSFYNKDEVDQIIADLPVSDTYTKSEIDTKIDDVSNNIPTKVSDLQNDKGYLVQNDVSTFITEEALEQYAKIEDVPTKVSELQNDSSYITENELGTALEGYAKTEDVPTKVSELDNDEGYLVSDDVSTFIKEDDLQGYAKTEDIPTKVSELDNDEGYLVQNDVSTFIKEDDLQGYAKTEDIPTKVSELQNDSSYLTPLDVSTMVDESELSQVAFSGDYDDLENKPTIPVVPTNVSAFNNDAGYLVSNDVSTLVDEDDLSQVAFTGDYGDLNNVPDLTHFFDDAVYDSSTKKINFYHGENIVAFIDATAFIKDGMVSNVVIEDGYVKITFNTDAGKEEIDLDITDIFDANNYYDKDAIDLLLQGKQDKILNLTEIIFDASSGYEAYTWGNHANAGYAKDASLAEKADSSTVYTKTQVDTLLDEKVDSSVLADVATSGSYNDLKDKPTIPSLDGYATQQWVEDQDYALDASLNAKADSSTVYTKAQVNSLLDEKADSSVLAMVATTGDYDDLTNKPTIPVVPTNVSAFVNDSSYLTPNDVSTFLKSSDVSTFITQDDASIFLTSSDVSTFITEDDASIFLKPTDVSTFITENDASIYLKPADVSTFITSTQAAENFEMKGWRGTQAQYDQLQVIEQNRLYIILPD